MSNMATRQGKAKKLLEMAKAFQHVMTEVLQFTPKSEIMLAFDELGYDSICDLNSMSEKEIMTLTFSDGEVMLDQPVRMKDKKKILHFLWWIDAIVSTKQIKTMESSDWLELTADDYDDFRFNVAPSMARGGERPHETKLTSITSADVTEFRKGNRRDPATYEKFDGRLATWFRVKRSWVARFKNDNAAEVIDPEVKPPTIGTEAALLFSAKNHYVYNVLTIAV